jgi:hypothetical protein
MICFEPAASAVRGVGGGRCHGEERGTGLSVRVGDVAGIVDSRRQQLQQQRSTGESDVFHNVCTCSRQQRSGNGSGNSKQPMWDGGWGVRVWGGCASAG